MPIDISVKQVPNDVADRLRERAHRNHRSLQGELRAILDLAAGSPDRPTSVVREHAIAYEPTYEPAFGTRGQGVATQPAPAIREPREGRPLTIDDLFASVSAVGAPVAGALATEDADEMLKIIEHEFERVDPSDWQ